MDKVNEILVTEPFPSVVHLKDQVRLQMLSNIQKDNNPINGSQSSCHRNFFPDQNTIIPQEHQIGRRHKRKQRKGFQFKNGDHVFGLQNSSISDCQSLPQSIKQIESCQQTPNKLGKVRQGIKISIRDLGTFMISQTAGPESMNGRYFVSEMQGNSYYGFMSEGMLHGWNYVRTPQEVLISSQYSNGFLHGLSVVTQYQAQCPSKKNHNQLLSEMAPQSVRLQIRSCLVYTFQQGRMLSVYEYGYDSTGSCSQRIHMSLKDVNKNQPIEADFDSLNQLQQNHPEINLRIMEFLEEFTAWSRQSTQSGPYSLGIIPGADSYYFGSVLPNNSLKSNQQKFEYCHGLGIVISNSNQKALEFGQYFKGCPYGILFQSQLRDTYSVTFLNEGEQLQCYQVDSKLPCSKGFSAYSKYTQKDLKKTTNFYSSEEQISILENQIKDALCSSEGSQSERSPLRFDSQKRRIVHSNLRISKPQALRILNQYHLRQLNFENTYSLNKTTQLLNSFYHHLSESITMSCFQINSSLSAQELLLKKSPSVQNSKLNFQLQPSKKQTKSSSSNCEEYPCENETDAQKSKVKNVSFWKNIAQSRLMTEVECEETAKSSQNNCFDDWIQQINQIQLQKKTIKRDSYDQRKVLDELFRGNDLSLREKTFKSNFPSNSKRVEENKKSSNKRRLNLQDIYSKYLK